VIAFITLSFFISKHYFVINNVICRAKPYNCSSEQIEPLLPYLGKSTFLLNTSSLEQKLVKIYKTQDVQVATTLPGNLIVSLSYPEKFLSLAVSDGDLVDSWWPEQKKITATATATLYSDGTMLYDKKNQPTNIYISKNTKADRDLLQKFFEFVEQLGSQQLEYDQITFVDHNIYIHFTQGYVTLFDITTNNREKIQTLQQILSHSKIKTGDLVDLRFNRIIIKSPHG